MKTATCSPCFLTVVSFGQKQNDNYNYFIKRATSDAKWTEL
jgi:hypothetical protein